MERIDYRKVETLDESFVMELSRSLRDIIWDQDQVAKELSKANHAVHEVSMMDIIAQASASLEPRQYTGIYLAENRNYKLDLERGQIQW